MLYLYKLTIYIIYNIHNMSSKTDYQKVPSKTDYQKVCDFNVAFDFPQHDNFKDTQCLKLRLDLIEEELSELKTAYNENDIIEEMDACADILYVAYGMAYTYKIDSDNFLSKYIFNESTTLFRNIDNLIYKNTERYSRKNIFRLIYETFNMLVDSTKNGGNWVNHLHDLIRYIYEFQSVSQYDSDKIFTLVHESNMSKLCRTEEEAIETVNKYQIEYENKNSPYDSPYYYELRNGSYAGYYIVKNKSSGKALKSINYTPVKLNLSDYIF